MAASGDRWWGLPRSRSSRCCRPGRSVEEAEVEPVVAERSSAEEAWWVEPEPAYIPEPQMEVILLICHEDCHSRYYCSLSVLFIYREIYKARCYIYSVTHRLRPLLGALERGCNTGRPTRNYMKQLISDPNDLLWCIFLKPHVENNWIFFLRVILVVSDKRLWKINYIFLKCKFLFHFFFFFFQLSGKVWRLKSLCPWRVCYSWKQTHSHTFQ